LAACRSSALYRTRFALVARAARRSTRLAALCLLCWLIPAAAAAAIDFDALTPLTDVGSADLPGVRIAPGLVARESDVESLLGFPAVGSWATSGDQGVLNSLGPVLTLVFEGPVRALTLDVLGLPVDGGGFHGVALAAFLGTTPVLETFSDPTRIGDSGLHEDTLVAPGPAFDQVVLTGFAIADGCDPRCLTPDESTTFWIDTLQFEALPAPAPAWLAAVAALVGAAHALRQGKH